MKDNILWGPSPRASLALMTTCRAKAFLENRYSPSVFDVQSLVKPILSHRLKLSISAKSENINVEDSIDINSKKLEIPVCCHENFSMDIKRLEEILKLSREKILENFLNKEYFCYMTGFIAGMPFLGDLDENMRAQRLETPRVKVPKGSVALTEQFANIYTFESPGGWNILGNTPLDVFDSSKEDKPNLINPGDTVVFKEITLDQYKNYNE
mgnify:CR=1 FL=1